MPTDLAPASQNQLKKWTRLLQGKFREEDGRFLAEGVKVVEELLQSDWPIEAIVVLPEKMPNWEKLSSIPNATLSSFPPVPLYQLSRADFKKLSQDKEPEGILAVVKSKDQPPLASLLKSPVGHILIAHEIANPQNLGALLRTARWFGFAGMILGSHSVDWTHPKAIRASMGAAFHLAIWSNVDLPTFLPEIKLKYRLIGSDVRAGDAPRPSTENAALLLGGESHGLPEHLLRLADEHWRIQGDAQAESLSLPQAAAIMMYEMSKKM